MLKFVEFLKLLEDGVPVNCAGAGNVAGLGGPNGEPGIPPRKKKQKAILRGLLSTIKIGESNDR